MRRLAGADAGFLFIEGPTQTSTCVDLVVLAAPTPGQRPLRRTDLRDHIEERLHLVPSLRWRLERVPLGVNHPVWIEDPDFDLDHHVRTASVADPGGDAEIDDLVAELLPGRLDRRHPLWQVVLIDGLADGRQALVFRFHHAIADGAGLITTMDALFTDLPDTPVPAWTPEHPRPIEVFAAGLWENLKAWLRIPVLLVETLRRFRAVDRHRETATVDAPRSMGGAPASVLNHSSSADRVFSHRRLPMAEVRTVRQAAGTTVSDVVLAVVAGALRGYLLARDQLPDGPLVANVPVGNDEPGAAPRQHGNVFANYFAFMGTDVADPVERLRAVAAANAEAKVQLEIQGRHTLPAWLDRIPPAVAEPASRLLSRRAARHPEAPDFNVLVSNVRVASARWHLAGHDVERLHMSGPVADGAGVNVTVVGYRDAMHVSVVANPSALDRPDELTRRMADALDELVDAFAVGPGALDPASPGDPRSGDAAPSAGRRPTAEAVSEAAAGASAETETGASAETEAGSEVEAGAEVRAEVDAGSEVGSEVRAGAEASSAEA